MINNLIIRGENARGTGHVDLSRGHFPPTRAAPQQRRVTVNAPPTPSHYLMH